MIGNWKMNNTIAEASADVETFVRGFQYEDTVEVGICPSFVALSKVRDLLRHSPVRVGGQDVFWEESGAFTGKVSPQMLRDAGCSLCLVGHSETRGRFGKVEVPAFALPYFAESDATVNLKLRCLLYHSIDPVLCVGETRDERAAGETEAVVRRQVEIALQGVDPDEFFSGVVAYEPVWAIGTGEVCDAKEASRVCGIIRQALAQALDDEAAQSVRILYGGSVKAANARELFQQPEIDGGLVGGASLNPHEFSDIVRAAHA